MLSATLAQFVGGLFCACVVGLHAHRHTVTADTVLGVAILQVLHVAAAVQLPAI